MRVREIEGKDRRESIGGIEQMERTCLAAVAVIVMMKEMDSVTA